MIVAEDYVYLVIGCAGEYDSCHEWQIAVYFFEDEAKLHVELAVKEHERICKEVDEGNLTWREARNKYDPSNDDIWRDTHYSIDDIPLFNSVKHFSTHNIKE